MNPSVKPGFYGWKNVGLLFLIYMSTLGMVFYGFSVIFPMMIKTLGWSRGSASIAHTICTLLMGFGVPLAAICINKIGARKTILIGTSLLLFGLVLLGTVTSEMWQWIILWGFVVGTGFAFCGVVPIQTILMYWFNINRGTAIGLVMTGAAAGGFLAQPFYTWLMEQTGTWQVGWLTGAGFALVGLIASFLLIGKPQDVGQYSDGLSPEKAAAAGENVKRTKTYRTHAAWEFREALKTRTLWFFIATIVGHIMILFMITSHGVLHFTDKGFTEMEAASVLSFVILGSGLARFPVGWLGDRVEPRWIISATLGIMLVMFIGLWKLTDLTFVITAGMILGFCYGSQLIMFPTLLGNYYGVEAFASINGIVGPTVVFFGAMVPVGAGFIFEKTGSYQTAFLLLSIILGMAFIASLFMNPPKKE
ncbi:MAG: MFS transporter [Desulfobacterales bacterium]